MAEPARSRGWRSRRLRRWLAALGGLAAALVVLPTVAGWATSPTIEAVNSIGAYNEQHHAWSPAQVTVAAGGTVTLSNPTAVEHGVRWVSGPETPVCTGDIPIGTSSATKGPNWSGACTFTKPGAYTFYCTVHGPEMTGTVTVPGTPTAVTEQPAELTQTGAGLRGTVNPQGNATEYRFEYGTATVSEHTTGTISAGSADFNSHAASVSLAGLAPSTQYHVELLAAYGPGKTTLLGGEQVFTTPAVRAPSVTAGPATGVTETGATLGGAVDPEGLATTYFFEYGLSMSYGHVTGAQLSGAEGGSRAAAAEATGLAPSTLYHFRLIAENASGGPIAGEDHTFTTASPPPPLPPPPPPMTAITTQPSTTAALGAISGSAQSPPGGSSGSAGGAGTSLLAGGSGALKLAAGQHGSSLRGSIDVSRAAVGGRLEVVLLATGASLAKVRHPSTINVGHYLRSSLRAGPVSFAVPLSARARSALHRHKRLALTVRIVLTPVHGAVLTVTRGVVLRPAL